MEWNHNCANGVEIIARTDPHLHKFCATLVIRCGSAYEPEELWGITHVMEHCIMRGMTMKYGAEFYGLLTRHGLELDARTNAETMRLELYGDPEGAAFAAELVEKLLTSFSMDEEQYRIEKGRIRAEVATRGTAGINRVVEDLAGAGSGYWRDVFGTGENVESFTLEQVEDYRRAVLKPGRVQLFLTGCLTGEDLDRFARAAERIPVEPGEFPFPEPQMPNMFCGRGGAWAYFNSYSDRMELIYDVNAYKCSLEAIVVMGDILRMGCDSLLYQELSEKRGLVYHCDCSLRMLPLGAVLHIGFSYDKARLPETLDALRLALERLLTGDFDLEAKKRSAVSRWKWDMDHPNEYAANLQHMYALTGRAEMPDFMDVTMEEVLDCAGEIFGRGVFQAAIFTTGPALEREEETDAALMRLEKMELVQK